MKRKLFYICSLIMITFAVIMLCPSIYIAYANETKNNASNLDLKNISKNQVNTQKSTNNADIPIIKKGNNYDLGYASDEFVFFIFNNLNMKNGDSKGRVAVGNHIMWDTFGIDKDLIVGNTIDTLRNGEVKGKIVLGSNGKVSDKAQSGETEKIPDYIRDKILRGNPIDFDDAYQDLKSKSIKWAQIPDTGKIIEEDGTLILDGGKNSGLNVFNITSDMFEKYKANINIKAKENSTILINISNAARSEDKPLSFSDTNPKLNGVELSDNDKRCSNILWNIPDANYLFLRAVRGSILAPDAQAKGYNGSIAGCLVAKDLITNSENTGNWEGHFFPFSGVITCDKVPHVDMPLTGGSGTAVFKIIGIGIMSAAVIAALFYKISFIINKFGSLINENNRGK